MLDRVRSLVNRGIRVFFRWAPFQAAKVGLFVWEAFVTKEAKAATDQGDAEKAVRTLRIPWSHAALLEKHGRAASSVALAA